MDRNIFLSVGKTATPEQEGFVCAIEKHLRVNGMVPKTVGRSAFSSGQPLKLVQELMRQCSGTVIIAFERTFIESGVDRRGSPDAAALRGATLPTVWNQIEAAMAYVNGHPLLVIVEQGLRSEGLLEPEYDWYVQRCELDQSVLGSAEFTGVFVDWKRRVEEFAANNTETSNNTQASITTEKLTLSALLRALTVPQVWAILSSAAGLLVAVAAAAFKFGQYVGNK